MELSITAASNERNGHYFRFGSVSSISGNWWATLHTCTHNNEFTYIIFKNRSAYMSMLIEQTIHQTETFVVNNYHLCLLTSHSRNFVFLFFPLRLSCSDLVLFVCQAALLWISPRFDFHIFFVAVLILSRLLMDTIFYCRSL